MVPDGRTVIGVVLAVVISAGCGSSTLETGYKPRPLNASDAERRAYYTGKYTKQAVRAEQERDAQYRAHRPGT
jgi:hypothetical protein